MNPRELTIRALLTTYPWLTESQAVAAARGGEYINNGDTITGKIRLPPRDIVVEIVV